MIMKRFTLFLIILAIGISSVALGQFKAISTKLDKQSIVQPPVTKSTPVTQAIENPESATYAIDGRNLTFVAIGAAGNAYGFYGDPRTYLWADPNINSVVFTHRMIVDPPGSYGNSRVSYDVSTEEGMDGTWTNNIQVYEPLGPGGQYPLAAGRYPQGAIYNPPGNTNPDNAWYAYFIPTIIDENGIWGGYAHGTNNLTTVDPPAPTQTNLNSGGDIWRLIPDAYTVTQEGFAWCADGSFDGANNFAYLGNYIFNKGTFNTDINDYEYDEWLMPILAADDGINDSKIAFDPTGQMGYVCVMSESPSDPVEWTNYHPILYMTDDGGENWSDEPIHCQFGGEDGIESVKSFISDEVLEDIYGAGYNRDEIPYNMGFHVDMVVDKYGNAHLTGIIACGTNEGTWYPNHESMGTFHVWYNYDEETWDADFLYWNKTFDGDLGGISEYNRPQISTDIEGEYLFISWIDTDLEGVETNTSPDIYCIAYDVDFWEYTEVYNVTAFTQGMWTAYYGSQSHYVFRDNTFADMIVTITVPFVYEECNPEDPAEQVQFWYIDGFELVFERPNDIGEYGEDIISDVVQNHPNPFRTSTTISVDLAAKTNLSLEVTNLIGQKVFEQDRGEVPAGSYEFLLEASDFGSGVYFYTVQAGGEKVTKKMIVE